MWYVRMWHPNSPHVACGILIHLLSLSLPLCFLLSSCVAPRLGSWVGPAFTCTLALDPLLPCCLYLCPSPGPLPAMLLQGVESLADGGADGFGGVLKRRRIQAEEGAEGGGGAAEAARSAEGEPQGKGGKQKGKVKGKDVNKVCPRY